MTTPDLSITQLILAYLPILGMLGLLHYLGTGLLRPAIFGFARMTLQLLLVGFYLGTLFSWNNPFLNLLWAFVMILAATGSAIVRSQGNYRSDFFPIFAAILLSSLFTGAFYLSIVESGEALNARILIPITGMLLGNSMNAVIIGLREFRLFLKKEKERYLFFLACGARESEAAAPFLRQFITSALSPSIATASNMGLVSLPGMMTGQILGGGNPELAVRYQILIMLAIFTNAGLSVILALRFSFFRILAQKP